MAENRLLGAPPGRPKRALETRFSPLGRREPQREAKRAQHRAPKAFGTETNNTLKIADGSPNCNDFGGPMNSCWGPKALQGPQLGGSKRSKTPIWRLKVFQDPNLEAQSFFMSNLEASSLFEELETMKKHCFTSVLTCFSQHCKNAFENVFG